MTNKNFEFKNRLVPEFYRYPLHNMIIGDYFLIEASLVTPSLHDYLVNKGLKSGKILSPIYEVIDDIKYILYMCIDDCDNILSVKSMVIDLINENGGKAFSSEIHDLLGGNGYKKFKNLVDVNEFIEMTENPNGKGRPRKMFCLPNNKDNDINVTGDVNVILPDVETIIDQPIRNAWDMPLDSNDDLAIDNDEKEFIFNPNLTDDEYAKLSFEDKANWQILNNKGIPQ